MLRYCALTEHCPFSSQKLLCTSTNRNRTLSTALGGLLASGNFTVLALISLLKLFPRLDCLKDKQRGILLASKSTGLLRLLPPSSLQFPHYQYCLLELENQYLQDIRCKCLFPALSPTVRGEENLLSSEKVLQFSSVSPMAPPGPSARGPDGRTAAQLLLRSCPSCQQYPNWTDQRQKREHTDQRSPHSIQWASGQVNLKKSSLTNPLKGWPKELPLGSSCTLPGFSEPVRNFLTLSIYFWHTRFSLPEGLVKTGEESKFGRQREQLSPH